MPFINVLFFGGNFMFTRRKKETAFAAQVTAVCHIIDGTADVELGYFFITLIPVVIEEGADSYHNFTTPEKGKISQDFFWITLLGYINTLAGNLIFYCYSCMPLSCFCDTLQNSDTNHLEED
jgi:hypothetical protein